MIFLLDLAVLSIKFYDGIQKIYEGMKQRAFENNWVYYAVYDVTSKRYILLFNHNKFLSVLFFYVFRYWFGYYTSQVLTIQDMTTLNHENLVTIIHYVRDKKNHYVLYNENTCSIVDGDVDGNVLYAYTDSGEDITHEFEKFKSSIFSLGLNIQDVYNIIMSYKQKKTGPIEYIKYMMDTNFDELLLKDKV